MTSGKYWITLLITLFYYGSSNAQLTYKELYVLYDSPWVYKNLEMIPIKFKPKGDGAPLLQVGKPGMIGFSDALQRHKVKVQEMQFEMGADVNLLQVTNHSRQEVMVQAGEVLEGGKQDRMIGETKFIAPGATDYVQVYCIEKRRWSDKSKDFKHAGFANQSVQKAMNATHKQQEVWKEIDKQFKAKDKTSETWSYLELYDKNIAADTGYINFFTGKYLESDSNLAGFIFITGKQILSTEIFASYSMLDLAFANMLSTYVDAVVLKGAKPEHPAEKVKPFMDKVLISEEAQKLYVNAHGILHKNDGKVIHLVAYPD